MGDIAFDAAFKQLPSVGWLAEDEARLLWNYATMSKGDILEIGTYHGRSAYLLASALRYVDSYLVSTHCHRVFCCDPFLERFDDVETPSQNEIVLSAMQSLWTGPLAKYISICWQTEEKFRESWDGVHKLGLVYIDGDHSYEGTLGVLKRWARVADTIAMHDYGMCKSFEGVQRAAADYGLGTPLARAGSMAVFRGDCR